MKLAIISVTANGAVLGQRLAGLLSEDYICTLYEKSGRQSPVENNKTFSYEALRPLLGEIWQDYDSFVFIMAVGIVVRDIATLIKHKSVDPAIIVMDELGLNCISLLSGHIGGANNLTKIVSGLVGANPVITTASDINGLLVPDAVSKSLNLEIESYNILKKVNGCIVAREKVDFYVDPALPEAAAFIEQTKALGLDFKLWQGEGELNDIKAVVFVSEFEKQLNFEPVLYLRPKSIIAGIGCKRGMRLEDLEQALSKAFTESGYSKKCLRSIASAWVKQDEEGLLLLSQKLNVPIAFHEKDALIDSVKKNKLDESDFVKNEIGVGNVCEAAALAHSQDAQLVKVKKSYGGITVALARVNFLSQV